MASSSSGLFAPVAIWPWLTNQPTAEGWLSDLQNARGPESGGTPDEYDHSADSSPMHEELDEALTA